VYRTGGAFADRLLLFFCGERYPNRAGVFLQTDQPGQPVVYSTIIQSFYQQFGILLEILFVGSCIFLLFEKEYFPDRILFIAGLFVSGLFLRLDTLIYTGYSRFKSVCITGGIGR